MIKFIVNLIKGDSTEDTSVSLETKVIKTKKELFDDAVKEVMIRNIEKDVGDALIDLCYTEEEIKQTEEAARKHEEGQTFHALCIEYPKAITQTSRGTYADEFFHLLFSFTLLKRKLSKEALNE